MSYYPTLREVAFFIALIATAVALGGALAHAYELPNKIGLPRDEYFVVQQMYAGWNRLAFVLAIQFLAIIAVLLLHWQEPWVRRPTIVALAGLVAAQLIFWVFTFPANQATSNWTVVPENWEWLRARWEYSHLAGAVCQLVCMAALVIAVLAAGRPDRAPIESGAAAKHRL